jgi:hypothetical protein
MFAMSTVIQFGKKPAANFFEVSTKKEPVSLGNVEVFNGHDGALQTLTNKQKQKKKKQQPEYQSWAAMKQRCTNKNHCSYLNYGGRGITYAKEWEEFDTFQKDMGPRPSPRHSLDRIDPNGNYTKGNCEWATKKEQTRNRRITKLVEHDGFWVPQAQLADSFGIPPKVFADRIRRGVDVVTAGTTPVQHGGIRSAIGRHSGLDQWPPSLAPEKKAYWERSCLHSGDRWDLTRPEIFIVETENTWQRYVQLGNDADAATLQAAGRLQALRNEAWSLVKKMGRHKSEFWSDR